MTNGVSSVSEYIHRIVGPKEPFASRFRQLSVELTERCNNNCVHCCINLTENDTEARNREMTPAQVKDILKQAAAVGYLEVLFTGGEPLLRPDFEELYLYTRKLGMQVLLLTNGRLITSRLADLFARIPPLLEIEISVYGMRPESYEAVTRAPGSFAQFRQGVDLLMERRVPFIVKGALLPQNRNETVDFEAWAETIPWMSGRPKYAMFFDLRHRRDNPEKNRLIASLRPSPREGLALYLRDAARYREWTPELAARLLKPSGTRLFTCGICEGHGVCVDAYGSAQPCLALRAPEIACSLVGSGRGTSLKSALDRFAHLRDLKATNPEYLRRCAVCSLKGICEQCPAKSWAAHGTFDTPVEYQCDVTHAMARHMGWLENGECAWEVRDWMDRIRESGKREGTEKDTTKD